MTIQSKTREFTLEHKLTAAVHLHRNDMLFACTIFDLRLGNQGLTCAHRLEEFDIGSSQNDVGVIYGDHGGIISQTENKTTVNQPAGIGFHFQDCGQFHLTSSGFHQQGAPAKGLVDIVMGIDVHGTSFLSMFKEIQDVVTHIESCYIAAGLRILNYYKTTAFIKGKVSKPRKRTNMTSLFQERIQKLRARFSEKGIDALLVLVSENRLYLSGFSAEDHQLDELSGALLITGNDLILATDSRFDLQARQESPLFEVVIYRKGLAVELPVLIQRLGIQKLGFESTRVSVSQYNLIQKENKKAQCDIELIPVENLVEDQRVIKTEDEILRTMAALKLAETSFLDVIGDMQPGMTEKEVAWAMEKKMREGGADSLSFPVIVAAGPNSALPHAVPSDRPIQEGEPVLFDWGARLDGYCSDTSRTVILGKPDETFRNVHRTVLEAQQRAIAAIRAGVSSKQVDAKARDFIDQMGFKGKFGHGLGHGTGLAVHEGPRLSPMKETTLEKGMIVTVEPGIYLPDWGGVRIENQVVVTDHGARVLNELKTGYNILELTSSARR